MLLKDGCVLLEDAKDSVLTLFDLRYSFLKGDHVFSYCQRLKYRVPGMLSSPSHVSEL